MLVMIVLLSHIRLIRLSIFLLFLWPSLVATFEACPPTRQSLKSLRRRHDVIPSIDWSWTLSAHVNENLEEDEEEDVWALNPETKRRIKKDGPKWQEFMNERGGYICHNSDLVPIQLDSLWDWTQKETLMTDDSAADYSESSQEAPNTAWKRLDPEILSLDQKANGGDQDSLPFLDELLFAYKPSGLLTLPGMGEDKQICLASLVNKWIPKNIGATKPRKVSSHNNSKKKKKKKRQKKSTKPFVPRPCHRLDYDTSGVMVVGLTRDSLRLTNAMFEQKGAEQSSSSTFPLKKTYVALVAGAVANDHGTINYPIFNEPNGYNEFVCLQDNSKWKKDDFVEKSLRDARTQYTVLKRFALPTRGLTSPNRGPSNDPNECIHYTKVALEPLTGRGHQLRLHMAAIGHPILGDTLHAPATIAAAAPRLCLHAEELELNVRIDQEGNDGNCMVGRVRVRSIPPF